MSDQSVKREDLQEIAHVMKRDWDERARQDARWFINPLKFRQTEEEFDQSGKVDTERFVIADLELIAQKRDPKSLRLFEIGCGTGRMTKHLAVIFGEIVGTDVSGEMVKQAQDRLSGVSNVILHETNGVDFAALPDESCDVILSAHVFQYVPSAHVIETNIREAWRVLKPGGVFKFQTNSIYTFGFEEIEKDTWVGASFTEPEIRRLAHEFGAQLISITSAGTRNCWTTLRKKPAQIPSSQARAHPCINFYSRTAAAQIKTIPTTGDQASLTVIASGLDCEQFDCNSVVIEIGDDAVLPSYLGPIGRHFVDVVRSETNEPLDRFTQIDIGVPAGMPSGIVPLRVRIGADSVSETISVEFEDPQPIIPRIFTIINAHDNSMDFYPRGERSKLRIMVEGLNEAADTGNVRVQIGERIVKPSRVVCLPGNRLYEVDAQLPDDIKPGSSELRIYFGNLQSPAATLEIKG
jgi:ubiquinone/menaquinone biosynthesis C-methylase UbiE